MKKHYFVLISTALLFFGCSSSNEDPPVVNPPETPDNTAPSITLLGLEAVVEVLTTLNITVTDNSDNVTSSVLVDGTEVFSSSQKQFSYELDPFDFLDGEHEISIESVDDSENKGMALDTFESKKLLFAVTTTDFNSDLIDLFFSLHSLEGKLIEYRNVAISAEELHFYAPDNFKRQSFIASEIVLGKNGFEFDVITSYADIVPGTNETEIQNARANEFPNYSGIKRDGSFSLGIMDTDFTPFGLFSTNYSTIRTFRGATSSSFDFEYDTTATQNIFIYTLPINSRNLDEYSYFILDDFKDQTISLNDFELPPQTNTVNLPAGSLNFNFSLRGFANEAGFNNNNFNQIVNFAGNPSDFNNTMELPVIDAYNVVQQRLNIQLDNKRSIESWFKGFGDIVIPGWSVSRAGNEVSISADYVRSSFRLDFERPGSTGSSPLAPFIWSFTNRPNTTVSIPFGSMEIPEEVANNLLAKGFDLTNMDSPDKLTFTLYTFEEETSYEELIFNFYTNQRGDQTFMTFDIND
ncbi:hypothetical protein [Spongiimicrobium sp. 2-473A-2-J]|uniref:hypothetical protein n=1 Tax=Eudoraea algarum TaxID=3417568 RepID=UPI003D35F7EE